MSKNYDRQTTFAIALAVITLSMVGLLMFTDSKTKANRKAIAEVVMTFEQAEEKANKAFGTQGPFYHSKFTRPLTDKQLRDMAYAACALAWERESNSGTNPKAKKNQMGITNIFYDDCRYRLGLFKGEGPALDDVEAWFPIIAEWMVHYSKIYGATTIEGMYGMYRHGPHTWHRLHKGKDANQ